jgi:hypothetical protein
MPQLEKSSPDQSSAPAGTTTLELLANASGQYVNQWNRLVSTTNWEKGQIIGQWREALEKEGHPATDYADEKWASLVGGVTGQHVGRLRRVHQEFGKVWEEYPGLFWSHFQVATEWDDSEMWLEGAVQHGWSVSQMRASRWEAHGAPEELKPREGEIIFTEMEEGAEPSGDWLTPATATTASVRDPDDTSATRKDNPESKGEDADSPAKRTKAQSPTGDTHEPAKPARKRPFANLPDLPDDVAEAFEQFKLVILAHKMTDWSDISRDDLLASLDALKELALIPGDSS